jgi:hypothetical protein
MKLHFAFPFSAFSFPQVPFLIALMSYIIAGTYKFLIELAI